MWRKWINASIQCWVKQCCEARGIKSVFAETVRLEIIIYRHTFLSFFNWIFIPASVTRLSAYVSISGKYFRRTVAQKIFELSCNVKYSELRLLWFYWNSEDLIRVRKCIIYRNYRNMFIVILFFHTLKNNVASVK